jgi:hypothetical protein
MCNLTSQANQGYDHYDLMIEILLSDNEGIRAFGAASSISSIFTAGLIIDYVSKNNTQEYQELMTNATQESVAIMYRAELLEEYEIASQVKKELIELYVLAWEVSKKYTKTKVTKKSVLNNLESEIKNSRDYFYNLMNNLENPGYAENYNDFDDEF